jgi:hypothetical protein
LLGDIITLLVVGDPALESNKVDTLPGKQYLPMGERGIWALKK